MLLLAFGTAENGRNRHIESMPDETGCSVFARRPEPDRHFSGQKNNPFHNRDEKYEQLDAKGNQPNLERNLRICSGRYAPQGHGL